MVAIWAPHVPELLDVVCIVLLVPEIVVFNLLRAETPTETAPLIAIIPDESTLAAAPASTAPAANTINDLPMAESVLAKVDNASLF